MKFARLMAAIAARDARAARARADQFPSRLITLVVPLTPGTTIDILARLYADKLSQVLGQQIVVLNKPGAGGVIGGETVANATPDGYTLLFANSGHSILGFVNKSMPFDPIHDFAGVSTVGVAPAIVVVPSRARRDQSQGVHRSGEKQARRRSITARRASAPRRTSPAPISRH